MDWAAIKKEYITTSISQRALAKKYGVSLTAIRRRSVEEGWVAARVQISDKTTTKLVEKASDLASEARSVLYRAALAMAKDLVRIAEDGSYPAGWKPRDVSGALKDCRDILDLKSEEDLAEQKARIEKLRREAQTEEQTREVRVKIEGAGDGWES